MLFRSSKRHILNMPLGGSCLLHMRSDFACIHGRLTSICISATTNFRSKPFAAPYRNHARKLRSKSTIGFAYRHDGRDISGDRILRKQFSHGIFQARMITGHLNQPTEQHASISKAFVSLHFIVHRRCPRKCRKPRLC